VNLKDHIVERTQAGFNSSKAGGRKGGRPKALGKDKREVAIELTIKKS
jgi:DNA invertase Pin-like site-specific DNA recombinase